jgi:L-histidine N-alpha-methyltransferase
VRKIPTILEDMQAGLLQMPRSIPPKYFYDARGSWLFERICETPEYYPTRVEARLLEEHAESIIRRAHPDHVVELGSGNAGKTRLLLDAIGNQEIECSFWPVDVCEDVLVASGASLSDDYPWLTVRTLVGDYHGGLAHLPLPAAGTRLFLFLGGTIGNFTHGESIVLLRDIAGQMRPGDALLLGADRVKEPDVLHAAYNDAAGITAEFNLNVLSVLNREIDADFEPRHFEHRALFNEGRSQIEMHLVSRRRQAVKLGALGRRIEIAEGEAILTEISRKFGAAELQALLSQAGLQAMDHFEAPQGAYSLMLARLRQEKFE